MVQSLSGFGLPASYGFSGLGLPRSAASGGSGASASVASAQRDVAASLSITTKEGDTFSISANFDATATYANVRGNGERASAWNVSASSSFSLQVQGDLSEQEMKDISRVVRTFMHDLRAMLRGKDVSIANVAKGDPQTLSSVSATADTSTTLTLVAAGSWSGSRRDGHDYRVGQPQLGPREASGDDVHPDFDGDDQAAVGRIAPQPVAVPVSTDGAAASA